VTAFFRRDHLPDTQKRERASRTGADHQPAPLALEGEEHTRRKIMSIYPVVLFLHVIGAIGYCLGMGILLFILLTPGERG